MKHIRKLTSILLVLLMALSMATTAFAAETSNGLEFDEMGEKTAEQLSHPGEYEIQLSVPGVFETEVYNEIIVMVDASTSQSGNFGKLKTFLIDLAKQVLSDDSSMRLTLMGFGVGPRRAGSFYSVAQLEKFLETATQEDLLQERSATNCEVGFEYVEQYINGNTNLKKAVVLYTSDGAANLDETALDWSKWTDETVFDYVSTWTKENVTDYAINAELGHINAGNAPNAAAVAVAPDACAAVTIAQQTGGDVTAALEKLSDVLVENADAYVTTLLKHIFAAGGLDWSKGQSASDVEKAFQTYFRANPGVDDEYYSTYMDLFYAILGGTGYKLADRHTRAAAASASLMDNDKVAALYHVGYSGAGNTWMNPENGYFANYDTSKLTYVYNTNFTSVAEDLNSMANTIVTTGYKDVTVTDPMSKWVTLDESSIRIVDNDTETVLWQNGAWTTGVQLTAASPITVTTNEDGNKVITWKIKDGWLLYTDRYSLRYTVNVDETEGGFVYGTEYPANDPTYVTYTDPDGKTETENITVPNVKEEQKTPDLGEGDSGIRIYKQTAGASKTPISDITFKVYKVTGEVKDVTPSAEEIATYAVEANLVATLTTDYYGYAFAKLESGRYLIVEQASAKVKAPVDPFYVVVPMYDEASGEYVNVVDIYPKNELVPETPEIPNPDIPEEDVDTTGTFSILKYDGADETKLLAGAQFQVLRLPAEGEEGTAYLYGDQTIYLVPVVDENGENIILTTDEKGTATSPELPLGLYFLAEIQAPDGYYVSDSVVAVYATVNSDEVEPTGIANIAGATLPSTGGIGTTIFYAIGGVLVIAAVILLVVKKRMRAEG